MRAKIAGSVRLMQAHAKKTTDLGRNQRHGLHGSLPDQRDRVVESGDLFQTIRGSASTLPRQFDGRKGTYEM
jgi:hypothetical protein